MIALSLGWGVQSWGLAAMVALGVIPPVDVALHADTTYERRETYEFAAKWTPWLETHGVRVVTVSDKDAANVIFTTEQTHIPAFTLDSEGKGGRLHRSCTQRWKIAPKHRWFQANRNGSQVEQLIGFSLDEWERARPSEVKYIVHRWPLIDDLSMTRTDIKRWLVDNGLEIPVKSSCVFCPNHSNPTWREIKMSDNGDWEKAVRVDCMMRQRRQSEGLLVYLHWTHKPLEELDLRNEQDHGQMTLWDEDECSGNCFL